MATLTGLQSGFFTDIDVVDSIAINGNVGTANQVLTSDGTNTSYQDVPTPAAAELITAGTGIDITATGNPETISTNVKSLVLSGTGVSGGLQTFNPNANGGSQTITINDTDTQLTLAEGSGIVITDLGGTNRRIATDIDADTIVFNGTEMEVAKVPNALTFTGTATGTYDGSSALTINLTDTQLNLIEGNGIRINSVGLDRTISVRPDEDTIDFDGSELAVLKVPNLLTAGTNITFADTSDGAAATTYDGSSGITISSTDTDTTYQGGTGISIDTTTNPDTINCASIPNTALQNSTISGIALGSNLSTLTFYNSAGGLLTSYNGANPPTSVTLDGDTTYQGGDNITIDTSTTPDTIDLDDDLTAIDSITMTSTPNPTTIKGNDYPSNPTTCSYLDLSDTTNYIPGGVIATKVRRTYYAKSFTNSYSEYSSDFRTSFKAQSTNVMVEFRAVIRADSKIFYGGLYDYNAGSYHTDQRNRFNFNDESDQDHSCLTWWMRNLTAGNTYYITPYFRGSSSTVYVYGGNSGSTDSFAPAIMRILDGGNNVDVY